MSTGRHTFRQNDLARAIRSGRQAGFKRPEVEIDPRTGKMTVRDSDAATKKAEAAGEDWDGAFDGADKRPRPDIDQQAKTRKGLR
jgi:hypothetical protein